MRSLGAKDYRRALDFLAELSEARDLDDLGLRLAYRLPELISCHAASYNEINTGRQRIRWITGLETGKEHVDAFERHMRTNPLVKHQSRYASAGAITVSDLVSENSWKNLGVYRDLYRPLGCEKILVVTPSLTPTSLIGIALFRDRTDFNERDRALLTLLQPHLAGAYRNAAALTDLGNSVELIARGLDAEGLGTILLDENDHPLSISDVARALITAYFGPVRQSLPDEIRLWLRRSAAPSSARGEIPQETPLVVQRGESALVFKLLRHGNRRMVLLAERRPMTAADLSALGLAPRQTEILTQLAAGKTDAEIAAALSLSPHTVSHTVERIYRKLGVNNRAGAVALALRHFQHDRFRKERR